MTDGIIQDVIRKITLDYPVEWFHRSTFITLEQELIEKIKQEFPFNTNKSTISDMTIRKILIGDNQE